MLNSDLKKNVWFLWILDFFAEHLYCFAEDSWEALLWTLEGKGRAIFLNVENRLLRDIISYTRHNVRGILHQRAWSLNRSTTILLQVVNRGYLKHFVWCVCVCDVCVWCDVCLCMWCDVCVMCVCVWCDVCLCVWCDVCVYVCDMCVCVCEM